VEVSITVSFLCSLSSQGVRFHRAMTRLFFTRERISDFEIYDRNTYLSLTEAKERLREGYSFDFQVMIWTAKEFLCRLISSSTRISFHASPSTRPQNSCSVLMSIRFQQVYRIQQLPPIRRHNHSTTTPPTSL